MTESLLRLVYVSTATSDVDKNVLQSILDRSSARNKLAGITGVLCSRRGHYMQVLEGPERQGEDSKHRIAIMLQRFVTALKTSQAEAASVAIL